MFFLTFYISLFEYLIDLDLSDDEGDLSTGEPVEKEESNKKSKGEKTVKRVEKKNVETKQSPPPPNVDAADALASSDETTQGEVIDEPLSPQSLMSELSLISVSDFSDDGQEELQIPPIEDITQKSFIGIDVDHVDTDTDNQSNIEDGSQKDPLIN